MGAAGPTCSVVIPVLDDARVLERCLIAVGRQRTDPLQVLVVDNGSRDDSAAVAQRLGATLLHESGTGIAAAASRGYDAATGELILRLDADSRPGPDWITRISAAFAADAALDALTGPGEFEAVPRAVRGLLTDWYWRAYFVSLRRSIGGTPLFGSNLAMRTDAWRRVSASVHRHDADVHDDLDLSIHLLQAGQRLEVDPALRVAVSAEPLLHPFGIVRRVRRAAHTLAVHTDPQQSALRWVLPALGGRPPRRRVETTLQRPSSPSAAP